MLRGFVALLLLLPLVPQWPATAAEDRPEPPDPIGVWRGELEQVGGSGGKPLQLVLRIRQEGGRYSATLDGLGAALRNLKLDNLILVEDVLSFPVPQVEGRFAGNFYGDSLRGIWSQGEDSRPLIFYRD